MTFQEILTNARTCIGPHCKACPVCNGKACGATMPGPGAKGIGDTAIRNYDAWRRIRINMDTISENVTPDTSLDFFGLGPWENYIDRRSASLLGHYRQRVEDQYHYGYPRSQESGPHTGLHYFRILDDGGNGLELLSGADFSASALPFSLEDLDVSLPEGDKAEVNHNNQRGIAQHSLELKKKAHEGQRSAGKTYVHADLVQMGVGGVNSWGKTPLEAYLLHPQPREFSFVIRPVRNR